MIENPKESIFKLVASLSYIRTHAYAIVTYVNTVEPAISNSQGKRKIVRNNGSSK